MADTLIGLVGDGFCLIGADMTAARSIVVFQNDQDKITQLDDFKIMACGGPVGDRNNFSEYVQKNMALNSFRNNHLLSTKAAANWTRNQLAQSLRSRSPYQVSLLLGGWDKNVKENGGASLYYMDYMGALHPMEKAAHGYGAHFCLSTLDRHFHKDCTLAEAKETAKKCLHEIATRLVLNTTKFMWKVVDKDGVRVVSLDDE